MRTKAFLKQQNDGDTFGQIDLEKGEILLANNVKPIYWREVEDWEKLYTFLHEVIHIFQDESGMELDEKQADSWALMMYDLIESYERMDNNNNLLG